MDYVAGMKTEFELGRTAYIEEKESWENPNELASPDWWEWFRGWQAARADAGMTFWETVDGVIPPALGKYSKKA